MLPLHLSVSGHVQHHTLWHTAVDYSGVLFTERLSKAAATPGCSRNTLFAATADECGNMALTDKKVFCVLYNFVS